MYFSEQNRLKSQPLWVYVAKTPTTLKWPTTTTATTNNKKIYSKWFHHQPPHPSHPTQPPWLAPLPPRSSCFVKEPLPSKSICRKNLGRRERRAETVAFGAPIWAVAELPGALDGRHIEFSNPERWLLFLVLLLCLIRIQSQQLHQLATTKRFNESLGGFRFHASGKEFKTASTPIPLN